MLEPVVGAQGAQERLLKRILGGLPPQPPAEEAEHHVAVLDVEALERRDRAATASIIPCNAGPAASVRVRL